MDRRLGERLVSLERLIRGNGEKGLLRRQDSLETEQLHQRDNISRHDRILCDEKSGVTVQLAILNNFMEKADDFMEDFQSRVNGLLFQVLAIVVSGVVLNLILEYVITKSSNP